MADMEKAQAKKTIPAGGMHLAEDVPDIQLEGSVLAVDADFAFTLSLVDEAQAMKTIQREFMESYCAHKDIMPLESWLQAELAAHLPDRSAKEITHMRDDILTTLRIQEEKKASLEKAVSRGRSKESWFAHDMKTAIAHLNATHASIHMHELEEALDNANESLYQTISTKTGEGSQTPQLDGFLAEQYHVQTFNRNAQASGSPYRAEILEPPNGTAENSVDIVIKDQSGTIVRRYQSKHCKNAAETAQALGQGDSRGQRIVSAGQEQGIAKKMTMVLEAPDGTTSQSPSRPEAKALQKEAQSGQGSGLSWNEYQAKEVAMRIGQQAGEAALMGSAVGVGFDVAQKVWSGEEVGDKEIVKNALESGSDLGVKAAMAGALKVSVEKELISSIPKGTPTSTLASLAHVAVENVKTIGKMATGKLSAKEGMERMERVAVATVAGISASTKGAAIGAAVGTVFGPVGAVVGGVVGGAVGYMAGSAVGETIVKGAQKIREKTREVVKTVGKTVAKGVKAVTSGLRRLKGWLFG